MNKAGIVESTNEQAQLGPESVPRRAYTPNPTKHQKIALFGHFGWGNFGNESTLQAMLSHLRRGVPDAEFNCICTGPSTVTAAYNIKAICSRDVVVKPWA